MICLVIAAITWMFFALSNAYVYQVNTKIQYVNFPQNKAFHPLQVDTISLKVEGTGWQLLFSRLPFNLPHINIDLQQLNQQNNVVLSRQFSNINRQLGSQKVIAIQPDTLYFDFSKRTVKRVPLKVLYDLKFKKQYNISSPVKVTPAFVTVAGPADELSKINYWETDTLVMKDVNKPLDKLIGIKPGSMPNLDVYPEEVEVNVPVEEFTEKTMDMPVEVIDNKQYEVKLLPQKVKVTFLVALNSYAAADRNSFRAVVDLNDWKDKSYTQLPVRLLNFSKFYKLIKIEPQTVDFIVGE